MTPNATTDYQHAQNIPFCLIERMKPWRVLEKFGIVIVSFSYFYQNYAHRVWTR